jgi:hypothetical protein
MLKILLSELNAEIRNTWQIFHLYSKSTQWYYSILFALTVSLLSLTYHTTQLPNIVKLAFRLLLILFIWNINIVAYLPHAGAAKTEKPWNTHTMVVNGVFSVTSRTLPGHAEPCLASPPFTSPCLDSPHFAPHRAFLGNAVNVGARNSTERCVLPPVRFRIYRRDWLSLQADSQSVIEEFSQWIPKWVLGWKWMSNRLSSEWIIGTEKNIGGWPVKNLHVNKTTRFVCNIWNARLL